MSPTHPDNDHVDSRRIGTFKTSDERRSVALLESAIKETIARGARRQVRLVLTPLRRELLRLRKTMMELQATVATRQIFISEWRLAVDQARQKLHVHIQRAFASKTNAEAEAAKLVHLEHRYLLPDPAGEAERAHQREQYERCKGMLEGLKERRVRETIKQLGLEGTTGQASLTVERLSDRPVRLPDLSDDWLLVALERHPPGAILVHHWLYSRRRATVHLLHVDEIAYARVEAIKVQRRDGGHHDRRHLLALFARRSSIQPLLPSTQSPDPTVPVGTMPRT